MSLDASAQPLEMQARHERWIVGVLTVAALSFTCGMTVADPDLWGHTLYGLRAAEQGVLAETHDPFSYTAAGNRWINHEWLTEYQFGWLWKYFGGAGLWAWRTAAAIMVFGFCVVSLRQASANLGAATLLLVFAAECLSTFFIFIRPQLATFVLFAATLHILRRHWDRPTEKKIWCLPLISGLWINLHGGFLAGLAIHGLFVLGWLVRAACEPTARRPFVGVATTGILAWVATLVNPYGFTMHRMLWEHLIPEQAVAEWQPLWAARQTAVYYLPFILLGISLVGWRRYRWIDLWVLAFVTFAAVRHIRHGALLCTALMILAPGPLSDALNRLFSRLKQHFSEPRSVWKNWVAASGIVILLAVLHAPGALETWRDGLRPWEIAVESSRTPPGVPLKAIALIRDENLHGNIVTDYAWGQYVLWHLYPQTRVAFDGRYRTVYPANLERQFLAFIRADKNDATRFELLDSYPTELVLLPAKAPVCQQLLQNTGWVRILHDEQACLFVKDVPKYADVIQRFHRQQLTLRAVPKWTLFPGGPECCQKLTQTEQKARHTVCSYQPITNWVSLSVDRIPKD